MSFDLSHEVSVPVPEANLIVEDSVVKKDVFLHQIEPLGDVVLQLMA